MCTLTWFIKADGYELFFNRDERKTRSRAKPPSKQENSDVSYIAPTDTDAGGTWIATNHFGVTVCLLNYYQFEHNNNQALISRGEIVRQLAISANLLSAKYIFETFDLKKYQAFRLFIIEANGHNRFFIWDGKQLQIETDIKSPKSSSSVNAQQVKTSRYQLFDELNLDTSTAREEFLNYHNSHSTKESAYSVCMHRDDANTVSLSHLDVCNKKTSFTYTDGAPCTTTSQETLVLNLV